jgi:Asp-tRNA(Asn)/Glu-tRNA(Gln) amidotransferase B subunit
MREDENITGRMLQDRQLMEECVDKNLAFLKSIPNSVQYWMDRKKTCLRIH